MSRRQFRVLLRDFLWRIVDIDALSIHARGDASALLGQIISLLIFLSLMFSVPAIYFSGRMAVPGQAFLIAVWTLQHFLIATTMLLVGLFAVLSWNSVFPDRRDVMILSPLPVRTRTVFLAKAGAVGAAPLLLLITLHALAGIVWPFAFNRYVPAQVLTDFASQPAMAPARASHMQQVLDHDFEPLRRSGAFARGGVSIGVLTGAEERVFAYGAPSPDSIYEIGSVTKTFTALALAQMVEQGAVKLDEPLRELLPPGTVERPFGAEITLLDLATHHSGLPRMPSGFQRENKDDPFASFSAADLYDYMARHGVKRPADASFEYSNLGLGLLGQVLADREHMDYADFIRREVTDPLGLTDTVVHLSPQQRKRLIQGYNGVSDGPDGFRRVSTHRYGDPVPPTTFAAIAGAGALHATARDLLRFLQENLHPGKYGGALAAALAESHRLRAEMTDSAANAAFIPPGTRIALIWWQTPDGCYMHGGAMPGYTAAVMFHPKGDWALAVLSNTGPGGLVDATPIAEHIRQRLEGLPALSLAPVKIPASGGFGGWLRLFGTYWVTMIAAGAFVYCSVLGLQGLAAELLPRQWFLQVSSFLQMTVFCVLVSIYFLQPAIVGPNLFDVHSTGPPGWSPSYWFLGLFQQLNGSPALGCYAARAGDGLAIAIGASVSVYALCYFRSLRKIVEQPDIRPGRHRELRLLKFGNNFETALVHFSIRTLLRSRQHRVVLAFYLGIGFGLTVFLLKSPVAREISSAPVTDSWRQVTAPMLAASMILTSFWIVGMRAVFSLPIELPANWIFRVLPLQAGSNCVTTMRRSLWALALVPAMAIASVVFFIAWPWQPAIEHLALLASLGLATTELCLQGNQKIPFTCCWLPGKSNMHIAFWICIMLILEVLLRVAGWERQALDKPSWCVAIALALVTCAGLLGWRVSHRAEADRHALQFEEAPSWQLTTLDLPR
ncbi:MAG: beta-lactamase family protein [Acidobacteriaceae bacterium]|nr:beta-lactamase family protein [Acidobacteriaceae bacterium]